jgi:hypothetical protein
VREKRLVSTHEIGQLRSRRQHRIPLLNRSAPGVVMISEKTDTANTSFMLSS